VCLCNVYILAFLLDFWTKKFDTHTIKLYFEVDRDVTALRPELWPCPCNLRPWGAVARLQRLNCKLAWISLSLSLRFIWQSLTFWWTDGSPVCCWNIAIWMAYNIIFMHQSLVSTSRFLLEQQPSGLSFKDLALASGLAMLNISGGSWALCLRNVGIVVTYFMLKLSSNALASLVLNFLLSV